MKEYSYYDFQQLDLNTQIDYLTEMGKYLSWKSKGEYNVYLYKSDDFFAEAWMHVRMSKIIKVTCSKLTNLPEGYDKGLKIS